MQQILDVNRWDNFLPQPLWQEVLNHFEKNICWTYGWPSDKTISEFTHWHRDFLERGAMDLVVAKIWNHLVSFNLQGHELVRCYANAHTYGVEGYPHRDAHEDGNYTSMLYIVPPWKVEWAGETMFFNDTGEITGGVLPAPNRVVTFNGKQLHAGRAVSRICPGLRVVLVFKSRIKPAASVSATEPPLAPETLIGSV